jgi:predicted metal-binding membrane protein
MTTMLVTGLASVWWMVLLAAATFIEQVSRPGGRLRAPLGAALIAFAILRTL